MKRSLYPFVSPATRFVAPLVKATVLPSALIVGSSEEPLAAAPPAPWLTSTVRSSNVSRTKMFWNRLSSAVENRSAVEPNTT